MAAPKGNKYAVGNKGPSGLRKLGAPPLISDEELITLGEELLYWVYIDKEGEPTKVHLSQFYSELKGIPYSQWKSLVQRSVLAPYYERAIKAMGVRILLNKDLPQSYGNRFLATYFKDVHEYERGEIVFAEEAKKKPEEDPNSNNNVQYEALMNLLKNLQSDRKIADNTAKKAEKSE